MLWEHDTVHLHSHIHHSHQNMSIFYYLSLLPFMCWFFSLECSQRKEIYAIACNQASKKAHTPHSNCTNCARTKKGWEIEKRRKKKRKKKDEKKTEFLFPPFSFPLLFFFFHLPSTFLFILQLIHKKVSFTLCIHTAPIICLVPPILF